MAPLDLTPAPLFDELLELDFGAGPEDLHDDYACRTFVDDGDGLAFIFRRADGTEISLIFEAAVLLESAGRFEAGATLDQFHRGRYSGPETADALVEQYGSRFFYYLGFVEANFDLTLAATRVTASFTAT